MNYKQHTNCRVCGNDKLRQYIDLGKLPLSNNLCLTKYENPERFPLQVMLCEECGLSQLSIVIDPEVLFGHYVYRSSINGGYVAHCRQMGKDLRNRYGLSNESKMIDIAGNDGALLKEFKEEIACDVLNVDPAKNLAAICNAKGIKTIPAFWSNDTANALVTTYGKVDLITATNVFAHVDDVYDFMQGVKSILKDDGVLVMEFPYLIDFIENNEFDTIYFEHLSYFGITPLSYLCNDTGLELFAAERQKIHGGSIRVHISHKRGRMTSSVLSHIEEEAKYKEVLPYMKFAVSSYESVNLFRDNIACLNIKGYKIAGFAASAKGNTLLNCAHITNVSMQYIVDETEEKIGKFSTGTHIPIVSMDQLVSDPPDYLVVLSWNFFEEIKAKCDKAGYKGKYIIPIPKFTVIE
jgi:ubiquinone/menaquinone biosynthesis C-methylase UbiE